MDRLTVVFSFAGVGCFALAFVLSGLYPYMITDAKEAEASFLEIAKEVARGRHDGRDRRSVERLP